MNIQKGLVIKSLQFSSLDHQAFFSFVSYLVVGLLIYCYYKTTKYRMSIYYGIFSGNKSINVTCTFIHFSARLLNISC